MTKAQRKMTDYRPSIPRPQSPEAEWVDGLPPAGSQCECYHTDLDGKKQWIGCDVVGPYGDYVICAPNGGGFYGFDAHELRPIRTPEQRQREEFDSWIEQQGMSTMKDGETYYHRVTHVAWQAWKASRAALSIELPESYPRHRDSYIDVMDAELVVEDIEAAGVRVKP